MKARIENDKIKTYAKIPSKFSSDTINIAGGFDQLPQEVQEQEGFFDVVVPQYDPDFDTLGKIYFDEVKKVFTYPLIELNLDLNKIKDKKREEFNSILELEMTPALMFGVIEKLALGEPIPQQTIQTILALRAREAEVNALIDSIQDPKQMKKFKFDPVEIEKSKELLKSGRKA